MFANVVAKYSFLPLSFKHSNFVSDSKDQGEKRRSYGRLNICKETVMEAAIL